MQKRNYLFFTSELIYFKSMTLKSGKKKILKKKKSGHKNDYTTLICLIHQETFQTCAIGVSLSPCQIFKSVA